MGGLGKFFNKVWQGLQEILAGHGKAYDVFHALMIVLNLFKPDFADAVHNFVTEAAGFAGRSGEEKRAWVEAQVRKSFPEEQSSRINLAIEVSYQLLPEKLKTWTLE